MRSQLSNGANHSWANCMRCQLSRGDNRSVPTVQCQTFRGQMFSANRSGANHSSANGGGSHVLAEVGAYKNRHHPPLSTFCAKPDLRLASHIQGSPIGCGDDYPPCLPLLAVQLLCPAQAEQTCCGSRVTDSSYLCAPSSLLFFSIVQVSLLSLPFSDSALLQSS